MPQLMLETTSGTVLDSYSPCANTSVDTGGQPQPGHRELELPPGRAHSSDRGRHESADLEPRFRQRVRRA